MSAAGVIELRSWDGAGTMPYRHYGKWRARWLDEHGEQQSTTFDDFKSAERHERKKKAEICEIKEGRVPCSSIPSGFTSSVTAR